MDLPTMAALTLTLRCKASDTLTVIRFSKSATFTTCVNYVTCKSLHQIIQQSGTFVKSHSDRAGAILLSKSVTENGNRCRYDSYPVLGNSRS